MDEKAVSPSTSSGAAYIEEDTLALHVYGNVIGYNTCV